MSKEHIHRSLVNQKLLFNKLLLVTLNAPFKKSSLHRLYKIFFHYRNLLNSKAYERNVRPNNSISGEHLSNTSDLRGSNENDEWTGRLTPEPVQEKKAYLEPPNQENSYIALFLNHLITDTMFWASQTGNIRVNMSTVATSSHTCQRKKTCAHLLLWKVWSELLLKHEHCSHDRRNVFACMFAKNFCFSFDCIKLIGNSDFKFFDVFALLITVCWKYIETLKIIQDPKVCGSRTESLRSEIWTECKGISI